MKRTDEFLPKITILDLSSLCEALGIQLPEDCRQMSIVITPEQTKLTYWQQSPLDASLVDLSSLLLAQGEPESMSDSTKTHIVNLASNVIKEHKKLKKVKE